MIFYLISQKHLLSFPCSIIKSPSPKAPTTPSAGKSTELKNIPPRNPKLTTKIKEEKSPEQSKPKDSENSTSLILLNNTSPNLTTIKTLLPSLSRKSPKPQAENILLRVQEVQRPHKLKESQEGKKTRTRKCPIGLKEEVSKESTKIRTWS